MKEKVGELNRRNFRAILEAMFAELDITADLGKLTDIRNSLVHRASFLTKDYWQEYTFLISILDRIFLRILNYDGVFLDIARNFEQANAQRTHIND